MDDAQPILLIISSGCTCALTREALGKGSGKANAPIVVIIILIHLIRTTVGFIHQTGEKRG